MSGTDNSRSALVLAGVSKRFGRKHALQGLDLKVPEGSITGLVGPNGAGKTTTFSIVCGFLRPDSGVVNLLGDGPFHPMRHRGRMTSFPQDAALGRDMPVMEQLEFLARLQGLTRGEARAQVSTLLEVVDLQSVARERIRTLSHGMLKRLGIGQTFIGNPELVLLDEPTNGLDPRHAHAIRSFILGHRGKRTVIISSHNLHEIESLCDHVAMIDHGRTVMAGSLGSITGKQAEIRIGLGEGPVPIEALRLALNTEVVQWVESTRTVVISFQPVAGIEAEDVIGRSLKILLAHDARIREVSRGQSLEGAYLSAT